MIGSIVRRERDTAARESKETASRRISTEISLVDDIFHDTQIPIRRFSMATIIAPSLMDNSGANQQEVLHPPIRSRTLGSLSAPRLLRDRIRYLSDTMKRCSTSRSHSVTEAFCVLRR